MNVLMVHFAQAADNERTDEVLRCSEIDGALLEDSWGGWTGLIERRRRNVEGQLGRDA